LVLPIHDWQFWIVSALALCAALYILRAVLPERWNPLRRKKPGVRTTLTISGKAPAKK
jgi:hypothetical protein